METRSREAFKRFSEVIWGEFGGIHVSYHQKTETLLTFFVLVQLQQQAVTHAWQECYNLLKAGVSYTLSAALESCFHHVPDIYLKAANNCVCHK